VTTKKKYERVSKAISVYSQQAMNTLLATHDYINVSKRLNNVCDRYVHALKATTLDFTQDELGLLHARLQDRVMDALTVANLHLELHDIEAFGSVVSSGFEELETKVKQLTIWEKYVLLEKLKL